MRSNIATNNDSNDSIVSETGVKFSSDMLNGEDFPQPPIHHEFGKPRQAMMSTTKILSAQEINHEDYDVSLSLFDTGADGNLRMNRKDLENNAPINVDIITAGNGEDGSKAVVGKDVYETFSPVVDYSTVRLLVTMS